MQQTNDRRELIERRLASIALRSSEERYRRLFETAQDGILIIDGETGKIADVNPFLTNILGYSHAEIAGKRLWELGVFEDIEESRKAFSQLQSKEYIRYDDLPLQTKDGRSINVEFVSNVYQVGGEKVIQCNIREITRRRQAEEAREKLIGELKDALAKIKKLSGLLPICASCKKIRDDDGYWQRIEQYISEHSEAHFSHGICPECMEKLYPQCCKSKSDGTNPAVNSFQYSSP
jgi:PAS domain S-box-containing protein